MSSEKPVVNHLVAFSRMRCHGFRFDGFYSRG